jgi:hypothetical protein
MSKHTKGPWKASKRGAYTDYDGNSVVILGDDMRVAVVHHHGDRSSTANARLIAAAPEMLEALERCLGYIERDETTHGRNFPEGNVARAAIAKARGETK